MLASAVLIGSMLATVSELRDKQFRLFNYNVFFILSHPAGMCSYCDGTLPPPHVPRLYHNM